MPDSTVRRRLLALAATVACAVALLPGQPAAAAPPSVDPAVLRLAPEKPSESCAATLSRAAGAARGRAGTAPCVEMETLTRTTPTAAAEDNSLAVNCGASAWEYDRRGACATAGLTLTVYHIPSGTPIGVIVMTTSFMVDLGGIDGRPRYNVTVRVTALAGAVIGTFILHEGYCEYGCSGFTGGSPRLVDYAGASANFILNAGTTATAPGAVHDASMMLYYWFANVAWTPQYSNAVGASSPRFRCDNAVPGLNEPGCVYPLIRPAYRPSPANGSYLRHLQLAINHYNMPRTLNRTTEEFDQTQNHRRACPGMHQPPGGYSCDEYPFQSTSQGAYTGGWPQGYTFDGCQIDWVPVRHVGADGWSVCYIPAFENSSGGNELNRFYVNNRVLNRDAFDVVP
ncbi:NucA/NucB deoxyribonuclease domain-containing protein [Plantactinospora endophytica]|uniref:Deoxyribonuclease NucA/NucB domain-containing protein n=1 Tax=Plantactinospora endophytica TaxID=673535 RepID=A0ABQ4E7W9_9ACTN|nr:hypothetical protein [Plantactinospora endophytica]GIG90786.1 hypothetical protein Pen02_57220 [Plantactinospora endophytica]